MEATTALRPEDALSGFTVPCTDCGRPLVRTRTHARGARCRDGCRRPRKRRCAICNGFLCSYNPHPICWMHHPPMPAGPAVLVEGEDGWVWVETDTE